MEHKFVTPLKVGILVAAIAYFLFTLHATFTLSWIGEWERITNPTTQFWIFLTDVTAGTFLVFRFIAGLTAAAGAILYFAKKGLPQSTINKLLRVILVCEALYWIGLFPSGVWGLLAVTSSLGTSLFITTGIPCMVGSIAIPISLFILAAKLSPNKPQSRAIKWAWIAGVFYVIEFWLNNTGMWITTVFLSTGRDISYLTAHTEYLFSFALTIGGLLALVIYTAVSAKKAAATQELKLWPVGVVLTSLGLYYLWNYLAWIFFGGWNDWYAWVLGHNLDLWLLTLPLVGLPLLFHRPTEANEAT